MQLVENGTMTTGTKFYREWVFHFLDLEENVPAFYARLMELGWTPLQRQPMLHISPG